MKNIHHLRVTIEPWSLNPYMKMLHTETVVNGVRYTNEIPFEENDFESSFEHMMEVAKRSIVKLVKEAKP
jgi:hypothetical protein